MLGGAPFPSESENRGPLRTTGRTDVAVVGGGPIGLAIAWRAAQRGMRVLVHDPDPGSGASGVAAGMLAPVAEASFGEEALTRLLLDSAARWPRFAAEVAAAAGLTGVADLGYRTEGTLVVGRTADDLAQARRLWTYQRGLGLPITALDATGLHDREPLLAPGYAAARTRPTTTRSTRAAWSPPCGWPPSGPGWYSCRPPCATSPNSTPAPWWSPPAAVPPP